MAHKCGLAWMCEKGGRKNCLMPKTYTRKECFDCDYEKMIKEEKRRLYNGIR